jgi:hypothetical protein
MEGGENRKEISRRIYNRTSNKRKSELQEMRNKFFEKWDSNLKREDNSIWKTIKNMRKPKTTSPQYANIQHLRGHGQKVTRKMLNYLRNIFPNLFNSVPPRNIT